MKTIRIPALLLTFLTVAAHAQDTVDLKLKWPVGTRLVYRTEMKQNTEMQPPGAPQKMKQETNMTQEFAITSLKERDNGGRELEMEILSQKMEMKVNGNAMMTFDTKSPGTSSNPSLGALSKLVGVKLKYFTNADGSVEKMEGVDALLSSAGAGATPQVLEMIKSMLGDKKMNQLASFSNQLPGKPVKIGESWDKEVELPMGPMGTFTIKQNIKFSGWDKHGSDRCALLETTGGMSSKPADKPGPMGMSMTFESGKMTGKTWFDVTQGRALETLVHQEFTIKMEMPNPQGADKEGIKMSMPMVQDISMKLAEVGKAK